MNNAEIISGRQLFKMIPTGSENILYVPNDDSYFRKLVQNANNNGDCIINIRNGYFRPSKSETDARMVDAYIAREMHRAISIIKKCKAMRLSYMGVGDS